MARDVVKVPPPPPYASMCNLTVEVGKICIVPNSGGGDSGRGMVMG